MSLNKYIRTMIYSSLLSLLILSLLSCGGSTGPVPVSPPEPAEQPAITSPASEAEAPANRVDLVYFHPKRRCACISIELRTKDVIDEYFKDAIDDGKLTFHSYELDDPQNAGMVKKYGAASSQLFITTVINGKENIKHVEEVWLPQILNNGVAFDEFMQKLISQSLKDIS